MWPAAGVSFSENANHSIPGPSRDVRFRPTQAIGLRRFTVGLQDILTRSSRGICCASRYSRLWICGRQVGEKFRARPLGCLLYTSDAADE